YIVRTALPLIIEAGSAACSVHIQGMLFTLTNSSALRIADDCRIGNHIDAHLVSIMANTRSDGNRIIGSNSGRHDNGGRVLSVAPGKRISGSAQRQIIHSYIAQIAAPCDAYEAQKNNLTGKIFQIHILSLPGGTLIAGKAPQI